MELNNGAEGGTPGTTVSAANSGGASGDPFTSTTGTPTITFDDTHALGTLAYKVVAGTVGQQVVWAWPAVGELWGRFYLYSAGAPSASTGLLRFLVSGGQAARIRYDSTGTLTLSDAGNASEVTTAAAIPTGQWIRVEWHIQFVASGAVVELVTYNNPDSRTATETLSASATGIGVNCDSVQIGSFNNTTWTGWLDGLNINTDGFPGPIERRPTRVLVASRAAAMRAASW